MLVDGKWVAAWQALPEVATKNVAPEAVAGVPGLPAFALLPPVGTAPGREVCHGQSRAADR